MQKVFYSISLLHSKWDGVIKVFLCCLLWFFAVSAAYGSIKVTGLVKDASGSPVPGVNVVEKGTKNGVMTDIDGRYSINVRDENSYGRYVARAD